jgi:hypothetical protein
MRGPGSIAESTPRNVTPNWPAGQAEQAVLAERRGLRGVYCPLIDSSSVGVTAMLVGPVGVVAARLDLSGRVPRQRRVAAVSWMGPAGGEAGGLESC